MWTDDISQKQNNPGLVETGVSPIMIYKRMRASLCCQLTHFNRPRLFDSLTLYCRLKLMLAKVGFNWIWKSNRRVLVTTQQQIHWRQSHRMTGIHQRLAILFVYDFPFFNQNFFDRRAQPNYWSNELIAVLTPRVNRKPGKNIHFGNAIWVPFPGTFCRNTSFLELKD